MDSSDAEDLKGPLLQEDDLASSPLELNPSRSDPDVRDIKKSLGSGGDDDDEPLLTGREKRPIPTIVFILTPIVILIPLIFVLAAFLPPPPPHEPEEQTPSNATKAPSLASHFYSMIASKDNNIHFITKQRPTAIHLSLTGNPTEMNIHFTTYNAGKPVVEIAKKDSLKKRKGGSRRLSSSESSMGTNEGPVEWSKIEGVSTTYAATDMCEAPATSTDPGHFINPGQLHTVKVTKLEPNVDYVYRCGTAGGLGIQWSEYYAFRSSPSAGPMPTNESLTFIALADQGCQRQEPVSPLLSSTDVRPGVDAAQQVADLITKMINNQTINSIHHFGDLSYADGDAHLWDVWMNMIQPYASRVPVMVGVGNHDYDHTSGGGNGKDPSGVQTKSGFQPDWGNFGQDSGGECGVPVSKRFSSPKNGNDIFWYSYDQALVHTIMLSSEHNMTSGSRQYVWLEKDLAGVNRTITPWVVVEMHRPLYDSETYWGQDSVGIAMRDEIEELMYLYNVDLHLSGHLHSYLRTCNGLYQGKCNSGGPTYIIVGTGGAPLDDSDQVPNDWTEAFDESNWGIGRATVVNATALHWEFVAVGGNVTDEVWIMKDGSDRT